MQYYNIEKWEECVEYLNDYDVVGSNLKVLGPTTWNEETQSWDLIEEPTP